MPNKILCVHRGGDDDMSMYWTTAEVQSNGDLTWSGDERFMGGNAKCDEGVALAVFDNRIYCAYREAVTDHLMIAYWDNGARIWRPCGAITTAAICTPGLYAWDNKLVCVYQGDSGNEMYSASSADPLSGPSTWSFRKFDWHSKMTAGVSLTEYGGKLYCFHRGQPDTNPPTEEGQGCWWSERSGDDWAQDRDIPGVSSASGPAGIAFEPSPGVGTQLFIVRRGKKQFSFNDTDIYTNRFVRDDDYYYGLKPVSNEYRSGNRSYVGPSLVACGGFLYCIHPDTDDGKLVWSRWLTDNTTWRQATYFGGHRSAYEVGVLSVGGLMD